MNPKPIFEKKFPEGIFQTWNTLPSFPFLSLNQTHSSIFHEDKNLTVTSSLEGDAIFSTDPKLPIGVKTADCLPILALGKNGVAIIHAGWSGLSSNIILKKELLEISPFYFLIGPHISQKNYEVQEEFKNNFLNSNAFSSHQDRLYFSLARQLTDQIKSVYKEISVENAQVCTFEDPDLHSYRKDKTQLRNWNIFIPSSF